MPKKNPEERKEYNRQQYLKNKYNDKNSKTREEYILNFYSTIKTEYEFMMWVRNIKRVHKEYFSRESEKDCKIPQNTFIEQNEIINPNVEAHIYCIKSFLKVGERYVSLVPSKTFTIDGVPIFFYIKQIEETNIIITYCNIRFIKYGDGSAEFVPEWNDEMKEMAMDYKTIYNVRPFDEKEKYKHASYLLIRKDVNSFYGI